MADNNAKFPTTVYGVVVYNASEGREVCLKHHEEVKAARAAKTSAQTKEDIARYMRAGFPENEARFLATGGVLCDSVSTFI